MKKLMATAALLLLVPMLASAQNADESYAEGYFFVAPILAGPGSAVEHRGGVSTGFGGNVVAYKGLGFGSEVVYAHGNGNSSVGTASLDFTYHFLSKPNHSKPNQRNLEPFASVGQSFYFGHRGSANGYNLGGGVNYWVTKRVALRFEVRDHAHIGPDQFLGARNFLAFRFGMTFR
jgi:hypothetical protein